MSTADSDHSAPTFQLSKNRHTRSDWLPATTCCGLELIQFTCQKWHKIEWKVDQIYKFNWLNLVFMLELKYMIEINVLGKVFSYVSHWYNFTGICAQLHVIQCNVDWVWSYYELYLVLINWFIWWSTLGISIRYVSTVTIGYWPLHIPQYL